MRYGLRHWRHWMATEQVVDLQPHSLVFSAYFTTITTICTTSKRDISFETCLKNAAHIRTKMHFPYFLWWTSESFVMIKSANSSFNNHKYWKISMISEKFAKFREIRIWKFLIFWRKMGSNQNLTKNHLIYLVWKEAQVAQITSKSAL